MREIKFRAWDGKEMIESFDRTYDWENRENFTLMQFTGLKDKNGKEIYEGDIVQISVGRPGITEKKIAKIVEWRNEISQFKPDFMRKGTAVIIGNIYQNPELLK